MLPNVFFAAPFGSVLLLAANGARALFALQGVQVEARLPSFLRFVPGPHGLIYIYN